MKRILLIVYILILSGNALLHAQQDSLPVINQFSIPPDTSLKPDGVTPLVSQQGNDLAVPQVIPGSPDAASLGKYGSIQVGLYSGIPDISIPLYTIKTSKLELPISISYMASGFKVSEIASWIGLGWSLNAGGVITRSVVGKPDDPSGFWSQAIKSANQISTNDYYYLKGLADGTFDGESDLYFYNFMGHSGRFVYNQNNGITPFLIPEAPIKVVFSSGYYKITDDRGIDYKFQAIEYMTFTDANHILSSFKSSFYLTTITSADGRDSIKLTYDIDNTYNQNDISYTETIGQQCSGTNPSPQNNYHVPNSLNYSKGTTAVRLKQIAYATGKVDFVKNTTDRLDAPKSRLDSIKISDKNVNGTYTLREFIVFRNGYFTSSGGSSADYKRMKLDSLRIASPQDNSKQKYFFEYNTSTILPVRTSNAQDWWGFYNGKTSNNTLIKTETINFNGWDYPVGSANRDPDSTVNQACILKTIKYPTGGYTRFDYEPNYYGSSTKVLAGGIRVKAVRDFAGPGQITSTKIYQYGVGGCGKGNLLITAEGLSNSKQEVSFNYGALYNNGAQYTCLYSCSGTRMIISGRPSYDLTSLNGTPVVYPEVTVYDSSSTSHPNGKLKHRFNFVEDQTVYADKAYNNGKLQENDSWKGGDENYNVAYDNTGFKVEDTYSTTPIFLAGSNSLGTKVGWKVTYEGCEYMRTMSINEFYYFDYYTSSGFKKLTNTKKRQYSLSDSVHYFQSETNYYYENTNHNHQQLTRKSVINSTGSTGDTLETRYWYAADYDSNNVSLQQIKYMQKHNVIALPIKEQTYRKNKFTLGKITDYNTSGNPASIYIYETDVPQPPPSHLNSIVVPLPGYTKRASFTYDSNQNLVMVQKNDSVKTTYLWGYYNSYPVAQIENASYTEVQAAFGGTIPNLAGGGLNSSQNTTLRNGLPKALVSTYSYIPFYGMTSKTDPSAIATSFDYDGLARLKLIKDHDGRILKTYQYNYRP